MPNYITSAQCIVTDQGWYRIARAKDKLFPNSCVISMKRHFNTCAPEYQKIQFLSAYSVRKFISLAAISASHIWTKIRVTYDETNDYSYIEVYQSVNTRNTWLISVEDTLSTSGLKEWNWEVIRAIQTQETVSGVTVLTSMDLPANNPA